MTIGTITYKCWVCGYTVTVHDIACWLKHKLRLMSRQVLRRSARYFRQFDAMPNLHEKSCRCTQMRRLPLLLQ